jgi:hypothetical protein
VQSLHSFLSIHDVIPSEGHSLGLIVRRSSLSSRDLFGVYIADFCSRLVLVKGTDMVDVPVHG